MDILAALKLEEAKLENQLTGIRGAIVALGGARSVAASSPGNRANTKGAKRVMSAALRARLHVRWLWEMMLKTQLNCWLVPRIRDWLRSTEFRFTVLEPTQQSAGS
jgi:hypothetical protein